MLFRTPGDCAILVQISSAPCRERIYPFRFFVAPWRTPYTFIAWTRFGTMVETMLFRAPGDCAILVQISSAPCRERIYPFRFFVAPWRTPYTFIAWTRFGTMVETMLFRAPGDCAILVQISSAPCRERIYPFRLLVALWRFSYTFIAASRPETADKTEELSRRISAVPNFAASHIVGASIARLLAMVLPVPTGPGYRKNRIGTP